LKESMGTSTTSYQYTLLQCQPRQFINGTTQFIAFKSSNNQS
jgi:hypothetical protein